MMLSTVYQRKNNDNTFIDINSDTQPKITSNCSFAHCIRVGLAVTSAVGMITLLRTTGFLSLSWPSDDIAPGNSLDMSQLITSRGGITFADNRFLVQSRHEKRAFGSEFQINTYTLLDQKYPSVAALSTAGFVVVWESYGQDASGYGIYGQRFSSTGTPQGSEFQINTYSTLDQENLSVVGLSMDNFVVTWNSDGQDGDNHGIYGQRFSSIGVPQNNEFQISTYTTDRQFWPSVAALGTGDFVAVWNSEGQDGNGNGIYGRIYFTTVLINNGLTVLSVTTHC